MQGKIIKGIAGFYYVHVEGRGIYECKAKGIFRKDHVKPLVGDNVLTDILDEKEMLGNIREILPRKSALIRPAVANVDQALILFAVVKPDPNFNLLNRTRQPQVSYACRSSSFSSRDAISCLLKQIMVCRCCCCIRINSLSRRLKFGSGFTTANKISA